LIARAIERSWIGNGLAALKDDEIAAECAGVPSLRIKLLATTISGALLGAIGAPFPYFITYVDPASAFSLTIAVNAIAMPLIGGTATWLGPVIGALLLGTLQQVATVTISSALSLLLVGVLLVIFITVAPNGIVGFVRGLREKRQ
jgi:branched-chain amino acid transport system permease protein